MIDLFKDKSKWSKIRTENEYSDLRDLLDAKYAEFKNDEIPNLKFSTFMKSLTTGDRKMYEDLYFKRREMMTAFALLSLIYPENNEYIERLEDIICAICEEYSWCVPAHMPADRLNSPCHIDLFASETGLYLAEIKFILSDRLSPLVVERITKELDRRIIQSFRNNSFIFEKYKSNWAAVCGGSVGATLLYENMDVYMEVKPRIEKCMEHYLESIDDEGVTSEGSDYLQYGLSYYLIYNDLLKDVTYGRIDNICKDKIKRAAEYISNVNMSMDNRYSYADNSAEQIADVWYINYLKDNVNNELPEYFGTKLFGYKTTWTLRNFLLYRPTTRKRLENKTSYYKKFGCVVSRRDTYSIGIKAGHNNEEHNHNDVASFQLVADNKSLLCDLGAPLYTMKTFDIKNFDLIIEKSSFGHNVPIINGKPQRYGREYCGDMKFENNTVSIDFKNAYSEEITKLTRTFKLEDKQVLLCDEFGSEVKWQERFVTETEPRLLDGYVKIDCLNIEYDKSKLTPTAEKIVTKNHSGSDRIVYLITFNPIENESEAQFEFTFDEGTTRG